LVWMLLQALRMDRRMEFHSRFLLDFRSVLSCGASWYWMVVSMVMSIRNRAEINVHILGTPHDATTIARNPVTVVSLLRDHHQFLVPSWDHHATIVHREDMSSPRYIIDRSHSSYIHTSRRPSIVPQSLQTIASRHPPPSTSLHLFTNSSVRFHRSSGSPTYPFRGSLRRNTSLPDIMHRYPASSSCTVVRTDNPSWDRTTLRGKEEWIGQTDALDQSGLLHGFRGVEHERLRQGGRVEGSSEGGIGWGMLWGFEGSMRARCAPEDEGFIRISFKANKANQARLDAFSVLRRSVVHHRNPLLAWYTTWSCFSFTTSSCRAR
jgi:hypothetical protein